MAVGVKAVRVPERGVLKPQFRRFLVHEPDEIVNGAAGVPCQSQRGVVAGGKQQSLQKLMERIALPRAEIHE